METGDQPSPSSWRPACIISTGGLKVDICLMFSAEVFKHFIDPRLLCSDWSLITSTSITSRLVTAPRSSFMEIKYDCVLIAWSTFGNAAHYFWPSDMSSTRQQVSNHTHTSKKQSLRCIIMYNFIIVCLTWVNKKRKNNQNNQPIVHGIFIINLINKKIKELVNMKYYIILHYDSLYISLYY